MRPQPYTLGETAMESETSFWVAIPHEAIIVISKTYPDVGRFLANIALANPETHAPDPPKDWVWARYALSVAKARRDARVG